MRNDSLSPSELSEANPLSDITHKNADSAAQHCCGSSADWQSLHQQEGSVADINLWMLVRRQPEQVLQQPPHPAPLRPLTHGGCHRQPSLSACVCSCSPMHCNIKGSAVARSALVCREPFCAGTCDPHTPFTSLLLQSPRPLMHRPASARFDLQTVSAVPRNEPSCPNLNLNLLPASTLGPYPHPPAPGPSPPIQPVHGGSVLVYRL